MHAWSVSSPESRVLRPAACASTTIAFVVSLGLLVSSGAFGGSVWIPGIEGATNVSVQSIQERKFERVVRQQYDFSCGSAALATLLTYHYDDRTAEQQAFQSMYERGDQEKIARVGFSLLDMKQYLEGLGYEADGYKTTLDTLADAKVPAIALISVKGYRHFVVLKGLDQERVLLGDPALGLRKLPRSEFEGMWENGILFIIRNKVDVGQRNFDMAAEWSMIPRAPLGMALPPSDLAVLTVMLPGFGEF